MKIPKTRSKALEDEQELSVEGFLLTTCSPDSFSSWLCRRV